MDVTSKINLTRPPAAPIASSRVQKSNMSKSSRFKGNVSETSESEEVQTSSETTSTFSISSLDALFFNEVDEQETRRRQIQRGNDLLDQLETLRCQLLSGDVSRERLSYLSEMLKNKQGFIVDPQLEEIIREIETRVAVELAKLGFS